MKAVFNFTAFNLGIQHLERNVHPISDNGLLNWLKKIKYSLFYGLINHEEKQVNFY